MNIFFVMLPERGAFNATFTLARRLEERGHRVDYAGPPQFRDHVCKQGYGYTVVGEESGAAEIPAGAEALSFFRRARRRYDQAHDWYRRALAGFDKRIRADRPDLVLLDPLMWRMSPPFLTAGIPILGLNTTFASVFDLSIPPVFSSLAPRGDRGGRENIRNLGGWLISFYRAYKDLWIEDLITLILFSLISRLPYSDYRRYRARQLVEAGGGVLRRGEYGVRLQLPELVLAPRELDFPPVAARSKWTYVGACVEPGRDDGTFSWNGIGCDRPLLYCSLGTYSHVYRHSRKLFLAVVAALHENHVGWDAIIQTGTAMRREDLGPLPPHIHVAAHVPQLEILRRARIFITHGGLSSVRESIFFGVPMIVFPCWLDQMGNAARVEYHGIGLRADIARADPFAIRELIRTVDTGEFDFKVKKMQAAFHDQQNCAAGIEAIEKFYNER